MYGNDSTLYNKKKPKNKPKLKDLVVHEEYF